MKTTVECREEGTRRDERTLVQAFLFLLYLSASGTTGFAAYEMAADTLIATATGGTRPPIDPNGDPVINGDFTITRSGGDDRVGDGVDDRTEWRLSYTPQGIDSTDLVVSAILTMRLEPKDQNAANDNIEIDDCDCPEIEVGSHPLHQVYEISFEMLDFGYQSQLFIDSLRLNGGFVMRYQDDAIVSFAEVRLVVIHIPVVTSPRVGELWIAGEQDTIRWEAASSIDSVAIEFSVDFENGGGNFTNIVQSYPASTGFYVWDIPDSLLSRKCVISVEDAAASSGFPGFSGVFNIKGYVLTRVDGNGNYERFLIAEDSWIFANAEVNMWPPSWYQQFDYANGMDPFTNARYSSDFTHWSIDADPDEYPDWPSFVRTFGTDQCYISLNFGGILNPLAIFYWAVNKGSFGGVCAGFAGTAFLGFDNKQGLLSRFTMSEYENLIDVPLNDVSRRVVNEAWVYQLGTAQKAASLATLVNSANDLLQQTKEMLLNENGDNKGIAFFDSFLEFPPILGHAINPWKIEKDPSNTDIEYIYVYDNNGPGIDELRIQINKNENTWTYLNIYTGTFGMGLMTPSSSYLENANLPLTFGELASSSGTLPIELYNTSSASIVITNSTGDSIVCDYSDSTFVNTIPGAVPNALLTGYPAPPVGYYLPADAYSAVMSDFSDSSMHFAVLTDSIVLAYGREDAVANQRDVLSFDSGIGATNPDNSTKAANFLALVVGQNEQKQIDVAGLMMVQSDAMNFGVIGGDGAEIVNVGSPKIYDLALKFAVDATLLRFEHAAVALPSNATHHVAPNWTDLQSVPIYIDLGNDGTTDDTMLVANTVDVKEQHANAIPKEYTLSQNYPNPFNPTTAISYQLSAVSHVTLRVYNILGQEVETLVNGIENAGSRSVVWDARDVSSGVYFYRLCARAIEGSGSISSARKMIIAK